MFLRSTGLAFVTTALFAAGFGCGVGAEFEPLDGSEGELATTVALTAVADTHLVQNNPTTNYGSASTLVVDGDEPTGTGRDASALLQFDLSGIPKGSVVSAVTLRLYVTNASSQPYEVYALLRPWIWNQANWNVWRTGRGWQVSGARGTSDRDGTVLASFAPSSTGVRNVPLNVAGVKKVQSWLDLPSSNAGIIVADPGNTDGFDFTANSASDLQRRPQLLVTYSRSATGGADAGTGPVDGGSPTPDAGTSTPDAGTPSTTVWGDVQTAEPRLLTDPNVLWVGTVENLPDWKQKWGIVAFPYAQNVSAVTPPFASNGKVIQVTTPGSSNQSSKHGTDFRTLFANMGFPGQEEVYLRYYVYFPDNYDWVDGGKLPGLAGVSGGLSTGQTSSGGQYNEYSWSGRIMWKAGGGIISYFYVKHAAGRYIEQSSCPGQPICGMSPRWYVNADPARGYATFRRGAWNLVELHYKMNTPGQNNGVHRGWVNGVLGIHLTDVQYRTAGHGDLNANQIMASIFYGGALGPTTTQHSYFDDFVVSKAYVGPRQ